MANMKERLGRLENRLHLAADRTQVLADAEAVAKRLFASAASFDDSAETMSLADRLAMSPADHCAWAIRFAPGQADPRAIMALHGYN